MNPTTISAKEYSAFCDIKKCISYLALAKVLIPLM